MTVSEAASAADMERVAAAFRAGVKVYTAEGSPLYAALAAAGADDPEIVAACSERVRVAVQHLIHRGLRERKGIFA